MTTNKFTDADWLRRAYMNARDYSDDLTTQNGSVLVPKHPSNLFCFGANHIPRGVYNIFDRLERPKKFFYIEHAERDAIYKAALIGIPTQDATLYVPWFACTDCARAIISVGIRRVVGHKQAMDKTPKRWTRIIHEANEMLGEAGVIRDYYDGPLFDDTTFRVLLNGEYWTP